MQKVIEKVIESKNFELSDMLKKIDTLWVQGNIDEAARKILMDKARNNANTQNSLDILSKIEELDKRVKALENAEKPVEPEEPEEPIEEYVAGKWYYAGNKVMFEGKAYECVAPEGVVCVWSPADYPVYWEEIDKPL